MEVEVEYCVLNTVDTSKFDNNTATTNGSRGGGGVLNSYGDNITINASKFDGNTAISRVNESGGGILYSIECTITVDTMRCSTEFF